MTPLPLRRFGVSRSSARLGSGLLVALALLFSAVSGAWAHGELTQKDGKAGCVSETGTGGDCEDGNVLALASHLAVSPDGKNVYVAGIAGVAIFDRDPVTGALLQKPGQAGCISETGTGGECQDGKGISGPEGIAVSADGKNVYVVALGSDAVAILDRHPDQGGILTQKQAGTAGCISEDGTNGECQDGKALENPFGVAVSPDGENVYVASSEASAVAVLDRDADQEGALSQVQTGTAGCVSEDGTGGDCQDGKALEFAHAVAFSPDGKNVYVAGGSSVAILDRDADQEGALSQVQTGTAGCVSEEGTGGACQDGKALKAIHGIAVSPDGASVYAASFGSDAVSVLDRDQGGDLTQKTGQAGCVFESGNQGECGDGKALRAANGVAVSPDDRNVYAVSFSSSAISVFDRLTSVPSPPPPPHTTRTVLACDRLTVVLDSGAVQCVAVVNDTAASGPSVPTGEVSFSAANQGSFTPRARCALATTGEDTASCAVEYTPARLGVHDLTASYGGDADHERSRGTVQVQVGQAVAAVGQAAATAPNTRLTKKPRRKTFGRRAKFRFVSDQPGSTFLCKLDKRPPGACRSPFKRTVKPGRHVFRVLAINPQGVVDATPAVFRWKVRRDR